VTTLGTGEKPPEGRHLVRRGTTQAQVQKRSAGQNADPYADVCLKAIFFRRRKTKLRYNFTYVFSWMEKLSLQWSRFLEKSATLLICLITLRLLIFTQEKLLQIGTGSAATFRYIATLTK
jgi:hypothetical protein